MALSAGVAFIDILPDLRAFGTALTAGVNKAMNSPTLAKTGKNMTKWITLPILGAGAAAAKLAMDFEHSMKQIQGLAGQSEAQVNRWSESILKIAPELGKGPQELAEALYQVASSGVPAAKAMDVVTISAKASAAGLGDTAVVADAVTSAMNAYATSNLSAAEAADVLTQAVKLGKGEADQMAPVLGSILPTASELGVTFTDVGAALAAMTTLGDNAANASTKINAIMSALLKTTPQAEKAFTDAGLSVDDLRASLGDGGLLPTLMKVKAAVGDNTSALAAMFPNVRALRGVLSLTGNNAENVVRIFEQMNDATGATDEAFAKTQESAKFMVDSALAQLQVTGIELGSIILPAISTALKGIAAAAGTLADLPDALQSVLIKGLAVLAMVGPLLYLLSKLPAIINAIKVAVLQLQKALTFLVAHPAIAAIAILTTVLVGLWQEFQKGKQHAIELTKFIYAESEAFATLAGSMGTVKGAMEQMNRVKVRAALFDVFGDEEAVNQAMTAIREKGLSYVEVLRLIAKEHPETADAVKQAWAGMNQAVASALRNNATDVKGAIIAWQGLGLAGDELRDRLFGVLQTAGDVDLTTLISELDRTGLGVEGVDDQLVALLETMAKAGRVTRTEFIDGMLAAGIALPQAQAAAEEFGKVFEKEVTGGITTAGKAIRVFTFRSLQEFQEWQTATREAFGEFVFNETKFKEAFKLTTRQFVASMKERAKIAEQGLKDIQVLNKEQLPEDFKQWLIDQGPEAVHAFVTGSVREQKDIQASYEDITDAVMDYDKELRDLPGKILTKLEVDTAAARTELTDYKNDMEGMGFNVTGSNGEVIVGQGHRGGLMPWDLDTHLGGMSGDEFMAVLKKGEFVVRPEAVAKPGVLQMLRQLNAQGLREYHTGGLVHSIGHGYLDPGLNPALKLKPPDLLSLLAGAGGGGNIAAAWGGFANGAIPLGALASIGRGFYLAPAAAAAFKALSTASGTAVINNVVSAYRTLQQQAGLFASSGGGTKWTVAPPGSSMHGWGKAVDVSTGSAGWNAMRRLGPAFNWRWGGVFGDPPHFSYGITARNGWMGQLPGDTLIKAHRGEQVDITAAGKKRNIILNLDRRRFVEQTDYETVYRGW